MTPVRRIVAVTGEYQKEGQTRKRYATLGTVFKRDDGSTCAKIDSMPVGSDWNGWVNFYEIEDQPSSATPPVSSAPADPRGGGGDDIPV